MVDSLPISTMVTCSGKSAAASITPSTIASGAKSPPIASTAIFIDSVCSIPPGTLYFKLNVRKNREVAGNKKVFRVHLRKDGNEILFRKKQDLGRFGVILNNHLSFVEQIPFKNVGMVALVHFTRLGIS